MSMVYLLFPLEYIPGNVKMLDDIWVRIIRYAILHHSISFVLNIVIVDELSCKFTLRYILFVKEYFQFVNK